MRFLTDLLLRRTREPKDAGKSRTRGKSPRARLHEDAWSLLLP